MQVDRADIDLNQLANLIHEEHKPIHINQLAHLAVSSWLEKSAQKRQYAPGATYEINDTIQFNGRSATITNIQAGHNSKQGQFQILTLTFADDSVRHIAAGISGAPDEDRVEVTQEQVHNQLDENGLMWRTAIQDALAQDNRFIHFQNELGDQWCLAEMLPTVEPDELQQAWITIQSEVNEPFKAVPMERLISTIWGLENDGSDDYLLFVFALNSALEEFREVLYVADAGWMLSEHWRELQARPSLVGPRMPNVVPEATDEEEEEQVPELVPDRDEEVEQIVPDDIESWRRRRGNEATFTLRASHYYHHWLPLNRDLQRLFSPRPCLVTIYHRFGDQEASFTAVVNPEQKRIFAERAMYDAFYGHAIYPGAKLVISCRGSEYKYDIRTQPAEDGQSVIVRHIELDDDGELKSWDDEEPLRYQVDGDVFVADARWEDLPALIQQAEDAGKGIFSWMFKTCQEWQRECGSPLVFEESELFDAIHFGPRMTSSATISWELWRRLAFESLGKGRYQFHPEKGGRKRVHGITGRRSRTPHAEPIQRKHKTKSLTDIEEEVPIAPESSVSNETTIRPKFEVTTTGQLLATDLVSIGPLFEVTPESDESEFSATGYFVFQQKPKSEYDDQTGVVYNWRQGIPGSRQIQPGARFIYYRPGEQVFFGCGRIEWIETSQDENGRTVYDGQINDYDQWKPPLPLTRKLANQLSFAEKRRLGIGQAGIRKITAQDFETIRKAYYQLLHRDDVGEISAIDSPKVLSEEEPILREDEFVHVKELIRTNLRGKKIYTPSGKLNIIRDITNTSLLVQSSRGEAEVLWEWVEQIYNVLRDLGAIERNDVQKGEYRVIGGYRSAFIFGLLARFSHITSQSKPRAKLTYHTPDEAIRLQAVGFLPADFSSPDGKKQETTWTEQEIIDKFQAIRTLRKGDKTALHKPLLLLYALARYKCGDPRWILFSRVDEDLTKLLIQFSSESRQQWTEYPFWRLQNDGLWEILGTERLPEFASNENPKKDDLLCAGLAGGFPQPLYDALRADPNLSEHLIKMLLDRYFPQNEHQAILQSVGLATFDESILQEPEKPVVWTEEKIVAQFRNRAFQPLGNFAKAVPGEFSSNKEFQPFLTDPKNGLEIVDGSQIDRYEIVRSQKGINLYLDKYKYLASHKKNKKAYDYQEPRIVYQRFVPQRNSRRLIATILPAEHFCAYSVGYLTDLQIYSLGFLAALLNSNLLNWKFKLSSINNTVNGFEIEKLRIPVIDFKNVNDVRDDDYEERLSNYLEELINDETKIAGWIQKHLSNFPDPLIAIHDLLDLCAREVIKLHEKKQEESRKFVIWLEEFIGFQIDDRSHHIKTGEYYEISWAEFEQLLKREVVATEQVSDLNAMSSESHYHIKKEFERSLSTISPLLERIEAVNSLINQLVYRLYGLTDEEIAKVEGKV